MILEHLILITAWIIGILAYFFLIPPKKVLLAHVAFLISQILTWSLGLLVVENRLIEYPIREFQIANATSFTFEFFAYPLVSAFFVVYYPKQKGLIYKALYYGTYASALILAEIILEKHTALIHFIHWYWYWSWIGFIITLYITLLYCRWFFRQKVQL